MKKTFLTHNQVCTSKERLKIPKIGFTRLSINARVPQVDAEGRVFYKSQKTIIDNREKFKLLRVTDFGMSNLIAVGADKNLSHVSMSPDSFTAIANMERTISSIESNANKVQPSAPTTDNNIVEPSNNE